MVEGPGKLFLGTEPVWLLKGLGVIPASLSTLFSEQRPAPPSYLLQKATSPPVPPLALICPRTCHSGILMALKSPLKGHLLVGT